MEELIGMPILQLVAEYHRPLILKRYQDRLAGKDVPKQYSFDAIRKDGVIRHTEISAQQISFKGKSGTMAIIRDVTDRKKGEMALEKEKNRAEAIIESIGEGLFVIDEDNAITAINRVALDFIGAKESNVLGKKYDAVFVTTDESGANVLDSIASVVNKSINLCSGFTEVNNIYLRIKKSHNVIPISVCAAPVIDGDEKIHGSVVVFKDVSEEQRLSRAKSEFVSSASHQLNTPLGAIKLLTESLLNEDYGKINEKQKEYLDLIHNSNVRMHQLVHELLDVSRLESAKLEFKPVNINIKEGIEELIKEFSLLAREEGQEIVFTPHLQDNEMIRVDHIYFFQVIRNLISNALYYSPKASRVFVELTKNAQAGEYKISVKDSGIGIDEKDRKNIFTKFFRTDDAKRSRTEGSGLGLYVAKSIIESLGGKIWFESKGKGRGSIFYVTIPIRRI